GNYTIKGSKQKSKMPDSFEELRMNHCLDTSLVPSDPNVFFFINCSWLNRSSYESEETGAGTWCTTTGREIQLSYTNVHMVLSIVVCFVGIFINSFSVIILRRKEFLSSFNHMLCALAVVDLFVMAEFVPMWIYDYIITYRPLEDRHTLNWSRYTVYHNIHAQYFHTVSIVLTLSLAIWRYTVLKNPMKSRRLTKSRSNKVIIFCFVLSVILCLPAVLSNGVEEKKVYFLTEEKTHLFVLYHVGSTHLATLENGLLQKVNFLTYGILIKLIPCAILTFITTWLVRHLVEGQRNHLRVKRSFEVHKISETAVSQSKPMATLERNTEISIYRCLLIPAESCRLKQPRDFRTRLLVGINMMFLITEFP
ncbi:hypothetical protein QYM36_002902, partial [Artemia franciscana]